jgi:DNA-binding transcriptional LysR family regulator
VVPTTAGEILHRAVREGFTALSDALRLLDELRTGHHGRMAIATGATTIRHFMGAAVKEFRRAHPEVRLEFHTERSSERCLHALRQGLVAAAACPCRGRAAGEIDSIARKGIESSQRLGRHRWTVERTVARLAGCPRLTVVTSARLKTSLPSPGWPHV